MKKYIRTLLFCIVLWSCSDLQVELTPTGTLASTKITQGIETAIIAKPITPPPEIFPVETLTMIIATPTLISPIQFTPLCGDLLPIIIEETDWAYGLVTYNTSSRSLIIWGKRGPAEPYFSQPNPESDQIVGWFYVSADHRWLSYAIYTPAISFDYVVLNPRTGEIIERSFGDIQIPRYDYNGWLNASQVVIPIVNQAETYQWIAWSPFTQAEIERTVELTGIGGANEHYRVRPAVDPWFELVAYACSSCGEDEYLVKSLQTGETLWGIDIGGSPDTFFRQTPVWSPDGRFLTIIFGLNKVWIFNRSGEIVSKLDLPFDGKIEYWIGSSFIWSPDSNFLAFTRAISETRETGVEILSLYSFNDLQYYDLAQVRTIGEIVWSYDGTKLFHVNDRDATDEVNIETIFDLPTCQSIQIIDRDEHLLIGWINPEMDP